MPSILVDAGRLIALFRQREPRQREVRSFLANDKTHTTWPVITEVCHFLNAAADLEALITIIAKYEHGSSFDHLVRSDEHRLGNLHAE